MSTIIEDMSYLDSLLDEAAEYGLVTEVVTFGLMAMKNNPKLTIAEAVQIGYDEWVK
tara:strand:+ start:4680 stop:4850 length:171 start_codon:yes stop_codon:yes gene_type:complete